MGAEGDPLETSLSVENDRTKLTEKHAPAMGTTEISSVASGGDALYTPVWQHLWSALRWHAIC